LSALGQLRVMQMRLQEAETLFQRCLDIRRTNLPHDDQRISLVEARLAEVYEMMGCPKDAAQLRGSPDDTAKD
jgi:hypothetical protein